MKPHPANITDECVQSTPNRPYRLYRFMVPAAFVQDHNIAFAGALMTISTAIIAQVQALWLCAYLDGRFDLRQNDITYETMLHSQFVKWRYPVGYGARFPDFVFDDLPYVDLMLSESRFKSHRKNGKLAEWVSSYGPDDYRGLVDEWRGHSEKA